jgi:hydrogenase nickel incorporation protein HypA/HybF
MHELQVTKGIFQIVLKHAMKGNVNRVLSVNLEIGALSDLQNEWLQRYFDRLSRGTVVEGAQLKITRVPAVFQCNTCQKPFEISSILDDGLLCLKCQSKDVSLVSGKEYLVKCMEVQ